MQKNTASFLTAVQIRCIVALIEHNMDVVKELAFYTYFMHEGTIFCHGTQNCVLENPEVRELYMGVSGAVDVAEVKYYGNP